MVKNKVTAKDLSKFLNNWDRELFDLNTQIKKMNLKQKKERIILQKKEDYTFRLNK